MLISVIIPTRHRNDVLSNCLDQLAPGTQTLAARCYEVIVSDDGTESTAERLLKEKYPWALWNRGPQRGPASNRNSGAGIARGQWLVFTDDDCVPDRSWLEAYEREIRMNVSVMEGAVEPEGNPNTDLSECPINLSGGCFWSANIAISSESFREIGGFDENYRFAAYEDIDLYLRLKNRYAVSFVRDAIIRHPVRRLSLIQRLRRLPSEWKAFNAHLLKNQMYLIRGSSTAFFFGLGIRYIKGIGHNLRIARPRDAMLAAIHAFVGVPYMATLFFTRSRNASCS